MGIHLPDQPLFSRLYAPARDPPSADCRVGRQGRHGQQWSGNGEHIRMGLLQQFQGPSHPSPLFRPHVLSDVYGLHRLIGRVELALPDICE